MSISSIFAKQPSFYPPNHDNTDPFLFVDSLDVSGLTAGKAQSRRTQICDSIDWLPQQLKDLVDEYGPSTDPNSADFDADYNANKDRLEAEAEKLFTRLHSNHTFVNFYQLKQVVTRFGDLWGFVVSTSDKNYLKCYYQKSSAKPRESVVSPGSQRNKTSLKTGCTFIIKSAPNPEKKNDPRHQQPVRLLKDSVFKHDCNPGITEARLAKKASGGIFGKLNLSALKDTIDIVFSSNVTAQQIRSLLRNHVPDGYDISADSLRNFKERAWKYYLEDNDFDDAAATKLLKFQPLDQNETIQLPDTDICRSKIRDMMLQVLQGKDGCWKAKHFLELLKNNSPGFDFDVMYAESDGTPVAILWMTASMRKAWIRYGNTLFADMMKRKMNHLHWPYISLVGLDHEKRIVRFNECLCLEEDLDYYAWAMLALERMEPRRKVKTVRLIYADGIMTDQFLDMCGLARPSEIGADTGTDLCLDLFHLMSSIWPKKFGQHRFDQLEKDLKSFAYAETQEKYEESYQNVASALGSDPECLGYLKNEYYDHPERFAWYYVKHIPGNLGKSSSQAAESNHASIVAHLGPGSSKDMVFQIEGLLSREKELHAGHSSADARYKLLSIQCSLEATTQSEASALLHLSKWGYNTYWVPVCEDSKNYKLLPDQGDEFDRVHRIGSPIESARLIPKGGRCPCNRRVEAKSMCQHEYIRVGGTFDLSLFPERLLQPHKMKPIDVVQEEEEAEYDQNDSALVFEDDQDDNVVDDKEPLGAESSSDNEDNIPLDQLVTQKERATKQAKPQAKKSYSQLLQVATKLVGYASQAKPDTNNAIYVSLLELQEIVEGKSSSTASEVVETLRAAKSSTRKRNRESLLPRMGPEANKPGATRKKRMVSKVMIQNGGSKPQRGGPSRSRCSFCNSPLCRNVSSCNELKKIGIRIPLANLNHFIMTDLQAKNAKHDQEQLKKLVSIDKPILETFPRETKWLVIHSVFSLSDSTSTELCESDIGVEVSCLGKGGSPIDFGNGSYHHRMGKCTTVRDWISRCARVGSGTKLSKLITSHDFHTAS